MIVLGFFLDLLNMCGERWEISVIEHSRVHFLSACLTGFEKENWFIDFIDILIADEDWFHGHADPEVIVLKEKKGFFIGYCGRYDVLLVGLHLWSTEKGVNLSNLKLKAQNSSSIQTVLLIVHIIIFG